MKARVLYFITELDAGGAQTALTNLLKGLNRERFAPVVVCLYNGDKAAAQEIRSLGIRVIDLGMTAKWRLDALLRFYCLLRRERPTILHTWLFHANIPGRLLGRLAGVPLVISSERTMGMENRWRYWLNEMTDFLTDRVVCVSQQVADFVVGEVGIPQDKTVVISNGVQLHESVPPFGGNQVRAELGLPPGHAWLGTVARLDPVKRLDILLNVLVTLQDVHIVLVGDGSERSRLTQLSEELGILDRVHFVGQQHDVWPWLEAMDVLVLSSDWEGMPNAVLEAMSASLPVVATAVGGVPEVVIDGETGLLVSPRDPDALAQAIRRLLRDPDLRRQMGQAGRARVEECFTVERMVEQTERLYEELLLEKGSSVQ